MLVAATAPDFAMFARAIHQQGGTGIGGSVVGICVD